VSQEQAEKTDRDVLASVFAARVTTAKKTEEEVAAEAILELKKALAWIKSSSKAEGSFLWFCDEFDLDPAVVRKAIQEKRK
jgi:hypothetical protein